MIKEGCVLEKETALISQLCEKFPGIDGTKATQSVRRVYLEVPADIILDVLKYVKEELKFGRLCIISGLDAGDHLLCLYHVASDEGMVLNLKIRVSREEPVIQSVLPIYNGATFYEREVKDLLGIRVEGLPEGRHYPLPENWPEGQYPLRKDWKVEEHKFNP